MSDPIIPSTSSVEDSIHQDTIPWRSNTGGVHIVAKRLAGRFRQWKWVAMLAWLPFFLGPYLRWDGKQALLFDLAQREFTLFNLTLYPQDLWLLALTLLFFALLLAWITSLLGRVFCGFFCFQTVWTDIFTLIEGKCEGSTPFQAQRFNDAPWGIRKLARKSIKHTAWLAIALLTGLTFSAWFTDAYQLWHDMLRGQAPLPAVIATMTVAGGTYLFAGFMREQVCFWLCPYARLQSVMVDKETLLPHYDQQRGEPRAKRQQASAQSGSCIDCHLCVAVCPTGIDIRQGQQQGCITCGLCIDACDSVMEKTGQDSGLIRYASHSELETVTPSRGFRPRVWLYAGLLVLVLSGMMYGVMHLAPTEFNVLHQRQPLYVQLSDGTIQNHYTLKVFNKTQQDLHIDFSVTGIDSVRFKTPVSMLVPAGKSATQPAFVQVAEHHVTATMLPITLTGHIQEQDVTDIVYRSVFLGPQP